MNLSAVDVRRLNRRNIRTVAIAIGNSTSSLDPYPFDNILYLATVEAFTLEHLNSQALSRCQPCQTNFSGESKKVNIITLETRYIVLIDSH